jgi:hypothetical protein
MLLEGKATSRTVVDARSRSHASMSSNATYVLRRSQRSLLARDVGATIVAVRHAEWSLAVSFMAHLPRYRGGVQRGVLNQ